jgi:hypothetical protein
MRADRELSVEEMNAFGAELDALRQRTLADLGEADARYIRRIRAAVRFLLLERAWLADAGLVPSCLAAWHGAAGAGQDSGKHGVGA